MRIEHNSVYERECSEAMNASSRLQGCNANVVSRTEKLCGHAVFSRILGKDRMTEPSQKKKPQYDAQLERLDLERRSECRSK